MSLILVDENIPGAEQLLAPIGRVELFRGRELRAEQVKAASALLVRSVTPVNASLLQGSNVDFVGSTTIGTDHLDTGWLDQRGIRWCNAPGSNADSVVDYCLSSICALPDVLERLLGGGQVGIVGYGNVGSRLHARLQALGINCVAYDPYLSLAQCAIGVGLDEVLRADFVSLHTPLTVSGEFPTRHLLSLPQLLCLPENAVLLNAGRGEVLATDVLQELCSARPDIRLVLDVWEGEPDISVGLLGSCAIATPHIAGYSQDGKWKGLLQVAQALSAHWGLELPAIAAPMAEAPIVDVSEARVESVAAIAGFVRAIVLGVYDVREDDKRLREAVASVAPGPGFDRLRRHYPARREVSAARIKGPAGVQGGSGKVLAALGITAFLPE